MKTTAAILSLLLLNSCIITNTPGFYSGYKKLPPNERQRVVFTTADDELCSRPNDKRVYAITAAQLQHCLKENDTSVVYLWSPHCHSDVCISMSMAQYYCDKHHYKLYVIAQYYDFSKMDPQNINQRPVFSINHKHYGTDYCNSYVNRFNRELAKSSSVPKQELYHRFHLFHKDTLVAVKRALID